MKNLLLICIAIISLHVNAQLPSEQPMEELLPQVAKEKVSNQNQQRLSQTQLPSVAALPKQFRLNNGKTAPPLTQKRPQDRLPSNSDIHWPITQKQKGKEEKIISTGSKEKR